MVKESGRHENPECGDGLARPTQFPGTRGFGLHSKGWDLAYLTGSGVLVVIPLILYEFIGTSAMFVNLFVAGVIGGPHMYATFFRTAFDESFRKRHPWLIGTSLVSFQCW